MTIIVLQLMLSGLVTGGIYSIIALGYNVIYSTSKILNFCQGEFVMLGALLGYTGYSIFKIPLLITVICVGLFCGFCGLLLEWAGVRPVLKLKSNLGWIISTVAVGIIIRNTSIIMWGTSPLAFPPLFGEGSISVLDLSIGFQTVFTFLTALLVIMLMWGIERWTLIGKALQATSEDPVPAELMGINTLYIVKVSFFLSTSISGVAGVLISPITFADARLGLPLGIKGFAALALGGLGNSVGAMAGGILLGLIETLSSGLLWSGFHDTIAFMVVILILIIKPSGIFGMVESKRT